MLHVKDISFSYHDQVVLKNVSFSLGKGRSLAVMGESGSGKSTLLKAIYGMLHLDKGKLSWNGKGILGPNFTLVPGEAYMKYVSQDYDLKSFTTVFENIGQYVSVFKGEAQKDRVFELLQLIEMTAYADVKVHNLSGGQQQRVALARALAEKPEVLLLDEPFSSIDQFKKNQLRQQIFPYAKEKGITVITATHDPNDVLPFADDCLVLKNGERMAYETMPDLYRNPKTLYTAALFGEANCIPMRLLKSYSEIERAIVVYPHEFSVSDKTGLKVEVKASFFKGSHYLNVGTTGEENPIYFNSRDSLSTGQKVFINVSLETINLRLR